MSKANELQRTCCHEAGHAMQAWLEGEKIDYLTLDPTEKPDLQGVTAHGKDKPLAEWTDADFISSMRIALAGPHGEQLGPAPTTQQEREFARWEKEQHIRQACGLLPRFKGQGGQPQADDGILIASCDKDVELVFQHAGVRRCVLVLARMLQQQKRIEGDEVHALLDARLGAERDKLRASLITKAKEARHDKP